MKYYAYLVQKGEGCDYTIGCAQTLISFEANDDEHAKIVLSERIKEEYYDETELESALIFKNSIAFDVNKTYTELKDSKTAEKNKRQHIKDMEDFEKLRQKLGK